ncbi:glycosyltransferase family 2 protein [Alicyclobacillus macrosporangiidus]|uniref:glycosyltransferase family 2 protein n=1 Tax=Alicyclobacillus macrosporangiidus TaxID=392015 RepID=UPI0009DDF690|nr:glycosyltransferase family 2 protein [Alicyclobacillus macrosporangiidus]
MNIIGLMRVRNEELIILDSLDHLSAIVDGIIVLDDASNDSTPRLARRHPAVLDVIETRRWRYNRLEEETRHRQLLLEAAQAYRPDWLFYADCDERFEGDIREFLLSKEAESIDGIRISLFDAYMTPDDCQPYRGGPLFGFRVYFGRECRNILMIWKNNDRVKFVGTDAREPVVSGNIITRFYCQHYGKAISLAQWDETCDYYSIYFPEVYSKKWRSRKGKGIHSVSDFGTVLCTWDEVKRQPITIHP